MTRKGWYKQNYQHSLASKGVKTKSIKSFEKLDSTSKIKTQSQAEINYILYKTKLFYGETDDIEKAYFLLPDGTLISDLKFCGGRHDNINVEGVKGEYKFNYITGSISVVPANVNKVYLRIYGKPSTKQLAVINDFSKSVNITVDLIDCVEEGNTLFSKAEANFDINSKFDLGRVNRYFSSDVKGQGYDKVMSVLMRHN
jgi:hypothetical protein